MLIAKLQEWVEDATLAVNDLHTEWDKYGDFYQGIQDEGIPLTEEAKLDWTPVNLVYSTNESIVPPIKDSVPVWYVKGLQEGLGEDLEQRMTDVLQGIWYSRRISRQYGMAIRDELLRGTGFLKAWWNPDIGPEKVDVDGRGRYQRSKAGDADVSWLDPYSVYPDPVARSLEECEWLALANDMAPERAKRLYDGSNGGTAFDDKLGQLVADDTQRPQSLMSRAIGWVVGRMVSKPPGSRKTYRIWEVYHEGGRRLTIFSGQQLLWDGDNPTPGEAFPIVVFPMCERGDSFWGMPPTSQIIGLQTRINKTNLYLAQHLRLLASMPLTTNDQQAKLQIGDVGIKPGTVVQLKGPEGFLKYMEPPNLPAWIFAYQREQYEDVKTVSGVQDVMRGLRPGSVQSGIGIQALQESALSRPRDVARTNAMQLERLGQIVLEMIQDKYDGDRSFAYHNGTKFVRGTVSPDMLTQERMSPESPMSDMMGAPEEYMGGMMGELGPESVQVPISYRVVVEPEGNLPMNAMAQAEVAFKAAQTQFPDGPGIDREAFLEALRFPHRKEMLERMAAVQKAQMEGQMAGQAQQMEMAQQAMAMQAMGGAQGGPAGGVPPEAGSPQPDASGMSPGGAPQGLPQELLQGAPDDSGAQGPQDFGAGVEALLAPIMEQLDAAGQTLLMGIIEALVSGQPLTPEQIAWLESLPPELQMMLEQVLEALGIAPGGDQAAAAGGQGPMGLV